MRQIIKNNKVMLCLCLILSLFFSSMPSQAVGKEKDSVELLSEAPRVGGVTGSAVNIVVTTGSSVVQVNTNTGKEAPIYNGKEQSLVTGINIKLNNRYAQDNIDILWHMEDESAEWKKEWTPDDFKDGALYRDACRKTLFFGIADRNDSGVFIATGSALAEIKKRSVFLKQDVMEYTYNGKPPKLDITLNTDTDKEIEKILKEDGFNKEFTISEQEKNVGHYTTVTDLGLTAEKSKNYQIENGTIEYDIVPGVTKKNISFLWGKKWTIKTLCQKNYIQCDKAARKRLSLKKKSGCVLVKNNTTVKIGSKSGKKVKNRNVSLRIKLKNGYRGIETWDKKLTGKIGFPDLKGKDKKRLIKKTGTGVVRRYEFRYNLKKYKYATRIFVTICNKEINAKNRKLNNKILNHYVKGLKGNKNSYLVLRFSSKQKAKTFKVAFKIKIFYGTNKSKGIIIRK